MMVFTHFDKFNKWMGCSQWPLAEVDTILLSQTLIDLRYITRITAFRNLLKSSGTPCTNVPLFLKKKLSLDELKEDLNLEPPEDPASDQELATELNDLTLWEYLEMSIP